MPDPKFLHMWDLEGRFVCSYIGTIGMAHGLEVVLEAAERLKQRGRTDIRFCLVGDGARRRELEQEASRRKLDDMVVFTGLQPKEEMPFVLASSNACLVHLRGSDLFGSVIPSKIFEIMAMRRPIIMGVNGYAMDIVLRAGAGLAMQPDSAESLVQAVETLADNPDLCEQLGKNARSFVTKHFNRDVLAEQYLNLLLDVSGVAAKKKEEQASAAVETDLEPVRPARVVTMAGWRGNGRKVGEGVTR
jgi:glycosyltransferase involved in cell wall biosynthesis